MNKITNYIKQAVEELKKVTWPSKKETYQYTVLVIGISLVVAAFLGALDFGFNFGFEQLIIN